MRPLRLFPTNLFLVSECVITLTGGGGGFWEIVGSDRRQFSDALKVSESVELPVVTSVGADARRSRPRCGINDDPDGESRHPLTPRRPLTLGDPAELYPRCLAEFGI